MSGESGVTALWPRARPQGMIRWTGFPRIEMPHVVVSLAALMLYSICHQPCSSVTSPGGFKPLLPYFLSRSMLIVTR